MSLFKKASRSQSRLRLALVGPSGSGKTFSGLSIATELTTQLGGTIGNGTPGRIAVIDTEHGSASKYAGVPYGETRFQFDVLELAQFDPRSYIEAIQAAESEGYSVLIIDSLSHAWSGKGGALELVDKAAKRSKSNNTFMAWRDVTPLHNALVDAMIGSGCHIIATMRSKVDYVMESDPTTGKITPRKVGLAPIQREGMDYEFDLVGDLDLDHNLAVTKTRCAGLDGEVFHKPGRRLGTALASWLSDGAPVIHQVHGPLLPSDLVDSIHRLVAETNMSDHQLRSALARRGVSEIGNLAVDDALGIIRNLEGIAVKTRATHEIGDELVAKLQQDVVSSDASKEDESPADELPGDDHVIPEHSRSYRGEAELN